MICTTSSTVDKLWVEIAAANDIDAKRSVMTTDKWNVLCSKNNNDNNINKKNNHNDNNNHNNNDIIIWEGGGGWS